MTDEEIDALIEHALNTDGTRPMEEMLRSFAAAVEKRVIAEHHLGTDAGLADEVDRLEAEATALHEESATLIAERDELRDKVMALRAEAKVFGGEPGALCNLDEYKAQRDRADAAESALARVSEENATLRKMLDPAVVKAAKGLAANEDAHPQGCCNKCTAAIADLARVSDGAGCESGDILDVTEAAMRHKIEWLREERDALAAKLARIGQCIESVEAEYSVTPWELKEITRIIVEGR